MDESWLIRHSLGFPAAEEGLVLSGQVVISVESMTIALNQDRNVKHLGAKHGQQGERGSLDKTRVFTLVLDFSLPNVQGLASACLQTLSPTCRPQKKCLVNNHFFNKQSKVHLRSSRQLHYVS